jgi:sporulation protein YlmC with PRC-barrel domain
MVDTLDTTQNVHRLIASDRVEGTRVYNLAGDKLGSIKNFMVDKVSGQAEYAVIEFGGILGLGSDYYPVPWHMLTYDTDKGGYVVDLSKEQLDEAPHHGAEFPEYDHNYGQRVFDYYGMAYPYPLI